MMMVSYLSTYVACLHVLSCHKLVLVRVLMLRMVIVSCESPCACFSALNKADNIAVLRCTPVFVLIICLAVSCFCIFDLVFCETLQQCCFLVCHGMR